MGTSRRVLGSIFQQIAQHALNQYCIETDQRKLVRNPYFYFMSEQRRAAGAQCAADHFLKRLPLQIQFHFATLDSRHIQQIGHQCAHAQHFTMQRTGQHLLVLLQWRLG